MLRRLVLICLMLGFGLAPLMVAAQSVEMQLPGMSTDGPVPEMPAPLKEQEDRGAQVFYLGKFDSLASWVMVRTGQPEFYYATPGNKALIMGILFNNKGEMQTGEQLKKLEMRRQESLVALAQPQNPQAVPQQPIPGVAAQAPAPVVQQPAVQQPAVQPAPVVPAPAVPAPAVPSAGVPLDAVAKTVERATPAVRLFSDTSNANQIIWGTPGAPALYAYIDPNCPHCHQFLKDVEPFVLAGKVAVHMIPVGFDEKSRRQAAFALAAADGAARMVAHAKGDEAQLPVSDDINTGAVEKNTLLLGYWNLLATPIIIYRSGGIDGPIRLIRGRPVDITIAVADLLGMLKTDEPKKK